MPEERLHQLHNKAFRAASSDPANAAAFLRQNTDPPLQNLVACSYLQPGSDTIIDPHMAGYETDLLFSSKTGGSKALLDRAGCLRSLPPGCARLYPSAQPQRENPSHR
jgi:hypothetical protein